MLTSTDRKTLNLVRRLGVVRPRDLEARGIPRGRLYRLADMGLLRRQARGLYVAGDHSPSAEHALVQVAKRVPEGVVCLLSALRFHDLTTQLPHAVWIAIPEKARKPHLDYPPVRVVRFSGPALTEGVESHRIENVDIRITSVAKTVADCFKYRHKIGLDIALEALRQTLRERRTTIDEIDRYARICRVERVMRPYLQALLA